MDDTTVTLFVSEVGGTYFASVKEIVGDDEVMSLDLELVGTGESPTDAMVDLFAHQKEMGL